MVSVCAATAWPAQAQGPVTLDAGGQLEVGGEAERYWRALQVAGVAAFRPLSIRVIDAPVMDSSGGVGGAHPWSSRWRGNRTGNPGSSWGHVRLLRPSVRVSWNSTLPVTDERGPAWTGRGLTAEARAGVSARLWRLHLQVEPVVWGAENRPYELVNAAQVGMRDPRFAYQIDLPQRFGETRLTQIDPGNSAVWVALPLVDVGLSTRAQAWGPGREYPLMLSGNAGGFPHLYAGTRGGVPIGIGRLHARVVGGSLEQTAWSPAGDSLPRWGVGMAALFTPRGVPGLELGATRFIHGMSGPRWPGLSEFRRLVTGGLSGTGALNQRFENQLASLFFRWQVPRARFAAYGEMLRDDYSLDLRRAAQYPDDLRTFMLGVERVLRADAKAMRVVHAELVNGELPSSNLVERGGTDARRQFPGPFPPYLHGAVVQGHTHRGQLLGSPSAFGGAGWRVGYSAYSPAGRRSLRLERQMRLDWLPGVASDTLVSREVRVGLVGEQLRFQGGREWLVQIAPSVDLNRGLEGGRHLANLRLALSLRGLR